MDYEAAGRQLAATTAVWAGGIVDPAYPIDRLGELALTTSRRLRTIAQLALLGQANDEQYRATLSRSAAAWRRYLLRVHEVRPEREHHFCAGRLDPLFDAVAAGDFELAREIASLAPKEKNGRSEYEDDFCLARTIFALLPESATTDELTDLLERWDAFEGERESPRLDLCRALAQRDADEFRAALEALLEQHATQVAELIARRLDDTPETVASREICVEALAFLRLADLRGIAPEGDLPYCPSLARRPHLGPFPRDLFY